MKVLWLSKAVCVFYTVSKLRVAKILLVEANQLSSPKKPFPVSPLSPKNSNSEMVFALPPADDEEWEDSGITV